MGAHFGKEVVGGLPLVDLGVERDPERFRNLTHAVLLRQSETGRGEGAARSLLKQRRVLVRPPCRGAHAPFARVLFLILYHLCLFKVALCILLSTADDGPADWQLGIDVLSDGSETQVLFDVLRQNVRFEASEHVFLSRLLTSRFYLGSHVWRTVRGGVVYFCDDNCVAG